MLGNGNRTTATINSNRTRNKENGKVGSDNAI